MQGGANGPAESAASQQVIMLAYYCNFAAVSYVLLFLFGGFNYLEVVSKKEKNYKCPRHANMETWTFSYFHPHFSWVCLPLGRCVHVMICKGKDE